MPRLKMSWRKHQRDGVVSLWVSMPWSIELTDAGYVLHDDRDQSMRAFSSIEEAKAHAKASAYLASERRPVGRPRSAESCKDCGAPPSHQKR